MRPTARSTEMDTQGSYYTVTFAIQPNLSLTLRESNDSLSDNILI